MIWNIYRFIICLVMANFTYQTCMWLFLSNPISPTWSVTAFILASLMLWERLVISIQLEQIMSNKANNQE